MLPPRGLGALVEDDPLSTVKPAIGVDIPTPATAALELAATAMTTALATATTSNPTASPSSPTKADDNSNGECRLLGPFALWVQLALGGLALLSLVYKRWKERPQRPVKVWFFDASKQVVGSLLVHVVNVFMSMLTSGRVSIKAAPATAATAGRVLMLLRRAAGGEDGGVDDTYVPNPCSFYLLNLAIDTTLGIPILIVLIRITTGLVSFTSFGRPAESIQSGNYGEPPQWRWWGKQSVIYFCGLFGMKVCVLILFVAMPWISRVGDWALGWTEGNEKLQIIFVMMLFPLIMNAMQYYIIDSFIKKADGNVSSHGHQRLPGEDPETDAAGAAADLGAYDDGAFRVSTESARSERDMRMSKGRRRNSRGEEYDPTTDGDASTIVGSSGSGRSRTNKVLPTELYPKE